MISDERVNSIIRDCLFSSEEIEDGKPKNPEDMIVVEGVMNSYGLHRGRVDSHKSEIVSFLEQLPDMFMKDVGGGWSFLKASDTKEGEQWTGLHRTMDALFVLGMALGKVKFATPRKKWNELPGCMPYMIVDLEGERDADENT